MISILIVVTIHVALEFCIRSSLPLSIFIFIPLSRAWRWLLPRLIFFHGIFVCVCKGNNCNGLIIFVIWMTMCLCIMWYFPNGVDLKFDIVSIYFSEGIWGLGESVDLCFFLWELSMLTSFQSLKFVCYQILNWNCIFDLILILSADCVEERLAYRIWVCPNSNWDLHLLQSKFERGLCWIAAGLWNFYLSKF